MSEERYIPINKGHFELDTLDRHEEFHRKLASGWEGDYREYRRLWVDLAKTRTVRDYPLLVDIELASICNLKCPMCYTITDEFKQKVTKGFIDWDLYTKIIDEIKGKVYAIRLSLRGESTLHKRFLDCIQYAKDAGIQEVSTLTNGGKLKGPYMEKVVDAGLDWITISIDGMSDQYDKIRKPLTFENMLEKLKALKEYKESKGLIRPVVKVQGIWPAIRPYPTEYYNALAPLVDLVAYNPLIDYLGKDKDIVFEDDFACPQLYQRLVVGSDGRVMMCSNDEDTDHAIGNAYEQSIHEIWHSDVLNKVRATHERCDGFKDMEICRKCYYPRKTLPDEEATVNDRLIKIENYVNRPQQWGQ